MKNKSYLQSLPYPTGSPCRRSPKNECRVEQVTLKFCAAVIPQDAVQQLLAGLPDGHRRVDSGADAVVVHHEVLVKPFQSRYGVPAAGSRDGSINILKI